MCAPHGRKLLMFRSGLPLAIAIGSDVGTAGLKLAPRRTRLERPIWKLGCAVLLFAGVLAASDADAGCNIIPSATQTFRGALGSTNRPFAGPGDFVEVGVEPGR